MSLKCKISLLLGTLGHSGYASCTYCWQVGTWLGKVVFQSTRDRPRTDAEFRQREDQHHHVATTSLTENPLILNMIYSFPIDMMHTLDLGVARKQLFLHKKHRMFDEDKADAFIKRVMKYVPSDFTRKPRSSKLIEYWKALEFRMFALYIGIIFYLESGLNRQEYDNFLRFFISYRLLMGEYGEISDESLTLADELLNEYVTNFKEKYSELSYNFHALLHLVEVCRINGPLYKYSAYKFENFYQLLRHWIRKPSHLFQQIWTRWSQTRGMVKRKTPKRRHFNSYYIDATKKNNCVMTNDNHIYIIQRKVVNPEGVFFEARKVNELRTLFDSPISSDILDIYIISASDTSQEVTTINLEDIKKKMFKIPFNNELVIMPILHY